MTIIISAYLPKKTIKEINKYIPGSKRSKLLSQFIIDDLYKVPETKEGLEEILDLNKDEEMVIQPLFLAEEALYKIDSYIDEVREKLVEETDNFNRYRSMMIRAITNEFAKYVKENPVEKQKTQFHHVFVPAGIKERLDKHIEPMERSSTINSFIIDEYVPKVDTATLKKPVPKERDQFSIYLDVNTTLSKVDEIAREYGDNVKRSHITRDAVYQLLEHLEAEKPKKNHLEKTLERTLKEIYKHAQPNEIKEILGKYLPNTDKK